MAEYQGGCAIKGSACSVEPTELANKSLTSRLAYITHTSSKQPTTVHRSTLWHTQETQLTVLSNQTVFYEKNTKIMNPKYRIEGKLEPILTKGCSG